MQANLWSECIPTMKKLEFMLMPRLCALAEHAWLYGAAQRPALPHFMSRLKAHFPYFDSLRLNYRQENGEPASPEP